jgi:cell division protein FtsB
MNKAIAGLIAIALILGSLSGFLFMQKTSLEQQMSTLISEKENLTAMVAKLSQEKASLESVAESQRKDISSLNEQITSLNRQIDLLNQKVADLTSQVRALTRGRLVFGGLNITDLEIVDGWKSSVIGNVTNISNMSMSTVYVILLTYNPDGTLDEYHIETIKNLAVGEKNPFEFSYVLENNQTFRVVAVGDYGLTDIETGKIAKLLAEIEELKSEIRRLKDEVKTEVYLLTDREYYYSIIDDLYRANKTIIVAMYSMVYDPNDTFDWGNDLIRGLVEAKGRGINVTVVLEYRTYFGYMDKNLEAYSYLKRYNVTVMLDNEPDTDHLKLVIIDDKIVYVGSHNWSESALYHNHETSVKIVSEEIAQALKEYIEENYGIYPHL